MLAGDWTLNVVSEVGCKASLEQAIAVAGESSIHIEKVDPSFHWKDTGGAISILSSASPPSGKTNFGSLPRVYLSPSDGSDAEGVLLRAVAYTSATVVTAIIPAGLGTGEYDIIVIEADNKIAGVLSKAVTVNEKPPPLIATINPKTLVASSTTNIKIIGSHFVDGGTVVLACKNSGSNQITEHDTTNGISSTSATEILVAVTASIPQFAVCTVIVANPDTAFFEFSAVSVVNSAQKLQSATKSAVTMTSARRGHTLVTAKVTSAATFLWAIGGDAGNINAPTDTIETAKISKYGDLSAFVAERNALPTALTFLTGQVIQTFVYIAGGYDGNAASGKVYRSQILDPRLTTDVDGTILVSDDQVQNSFGEDGGFYFYRVAGVFANDDASNPGGESLPGEYFSIRLPKNVAGLTVALEWDNLPGATSYRLYRTPKANEKATNLQLLAVLLPAGAGDTTSFVDDGSAVLNADTPFAEGSLGVWSEVASFGFPSLGLSSFVGQPNQAGAQHHLYVSGGRAGASNNAAGIRSVAECVITVTPVNGKARESQTMSSSCTTLSGRLPTAIVFGGGATMTTEGDGISFGTKTAFLSSGGLSHNGIASATQSGSSAVTWSTTTSKFSVHGHCLLPGSNFVYALGGASGSSRFPADPSSSGIFSSVRCSGSVCSATKFSAMGSTKVQRVYHACASANAFFFISGGYGTSLVGSGESLKVQDTIEQMPM